jgi:uncharacterized protein (TIGR00730 family)
MLFEAMKGISRVCVYCASSSRVDPAYFEACRDLAVLLVRYNCEVVYGGGGVGLMGTLADTVLELGGKIIGIMPEFMKKVEWEHKGLSSINLVQDMHTRKKLFLDGTDAVIALPGGCGTMEELLEVLTWKRLGLFNKPIIILNTNGYYDPLLAMLERSIEEQFMAPIHRTMYAVASIPDDIPYLIEEMGDWNEGAIKFVNL